MHQTFTQCTSGKYTILPHDAVHGVGAQPRPFRDLVYRQPLAPAWQQRRWQGAGGCGKYLTGGHRGGCGLILGVRGSGGPGWDRGAGLEARPPPSFWASGEDDRSVTGG